MFKSIKNYMIKLYIIFNGIDKLMSDYFSCGSINPEIAKHEDERSGWRVIMNDITYTTTIIYTFYEGQTFIIYESNKCKWNIPNGQLKDMVMENLIIFYYRIKKVRKLEKENEKLLQKNIEKALCKKH